MTHLPGIVSPWKAAVRCLHWIADEIKKWVPPREAAEIIRLFWHRVARPHSGEDGWKNRPTSRQTCGARVLRLFLLILGC